MATSSSGITSTGIGTGLDISAIVTKLVEAEGAPLLAQLDKKKSLTDSKISALGSLQSALEAFQKAAKVLKDTDTFHAHSAVSSYDSIVTASADANAVPGSYSVVVKQLATRNQQVSAEFANAQAVLGTGTLSFQVGSNSFDVAIDDSHKTLASIRDAINNAPGNTWVSATIVNVDQDIVPPTGETVSRLVLTSTNPGTANSITLNITDDDGDSTDASGLSWLAANNLDAAREVAASDAVVGINGFDVTRSSNTITDAVDGLTLNLQSEAPSTTVTVTVGTDTEAVTKSVNDFITAYNNLGTVMKNLDSYDTTTKKTGALFADSLVRGLKSQVRSALSTPVAGVSAGYNSLQMIGIEIDRNGVMSLKKDIFAAALAADPTALGSVFGSADGVSARLESRLDVYLQTGGLLDNRNDSLQKTLRRISDDKAKTEDRLASLEARLLKQFNAMDSLVASLNATGTYLNQQLTALNASNKKS